jgi:hypothetical protein
MMEARGSSETMLRLDQTDRTNGHNCEQYGNLRGHRDRASRECSDYLHSAEGS